MTEIGESQPPREKLDELKGLSQQFDSVLEEASVSGDYAALENVRKQLDGGIAELRRRLNPIEGELHIEDQYESQIAMLRKNNILHQVGDEEYILGIDHRPYPVPSLEAVTDRLRRHPKELIQRKIHEGFTTLLLVPFAMDLAPLSRSYSDALRYNFVRDPEDPRANGIVSPAPTSFKDSHGWLASLNVQQPMEFGLKDLGSTLNYRMPYGQPTAFRADTKRAAMKILDTIGTPGWQIVLANSAPTIGFKNNEERSVWGANLVSVDQQLRNKEFEGESAMTPEEWLTFALTNLELKHQTVDDAANIGYMNRVMLAGVGGSDAAGSEYTVIAGWNHSGGCAEMIYLLNNNTSFPVRTVVPL